MTSTTTQAASPHASDLAGALIAIPQSTNIVPYRPGPTRRPSPDRIQSDADNFKLAVEPAGLDNAPQSLSFTQALGLVPSNAAHWTHLTVKRGDTLSSLFKRAGLGAADWRSVLAIGDRTDRLRNLRPGDHLALRVGADQRFDGLRYRFADNRTLTVSRNRQGLAATIDKQAGMTRRVVAHGKVGRSLSRALARARVPASVANQLGLIFKYRHNLARHIQPGATFSIMYRARFSGGSRLSVGPIIATRITSNGRHYKAFRARNRNGNYGYYDSRGRSFKRFISRHPVNYTHISSPFSLARVNPVTGKVEPHYGVDMAASTGTPIHAAAAGTIKFKGWIRGYGRIVKINDFEGYSTRYAHMHRFASTLHRGEHVDQGQIIGYVGQSGETTGPHLHFEIRRNGKPHNPMTMKLPDGRRLSPTRLKAFKQHIKPLVARLDHAANPRVASRRTLTATGNCG